MNRNPRIKISPEAVQAYQAEEYLTLHRLLGLRPWEMSPLDVDADDDPPEVKHANAWTESWWKAMELRAELEQGGA